MASIFFRPTTDENDVEETVEQYQEVVTGWHLSDFYPSRTVVMYRHSLLLDYLSDGHGLIISSILMTMILL